MGLQQLWVSTITIVVTFAGCRFVAEPPAGAILRCDEDADCPPNDRCNLAALRCVSGDGNVDVVAPIIEDVFFEPAAASSGVAALVIVANEALGVEVEPLVAPAPGSPPLPFGAAIVDGLQLALPLDVDALEEGVSAVARVEIADVAGNLGARDLVGVALTVDRTSPELINATIVETPPGGHADTAGHDLLVVEFFASEPLAPMDAEAPGAMVSSQRTRNVAASIVHAPGVVPNGVNDVGVVARDRANNETEHIVSVDVDSEAPFVVADSVDVEVRAPDGSPLAIEGSVIAISFLVNERMQATPVVSIETPAGPLPFALSSSGARYEGTLVVGATIEDGTYPIVAQLVDDVGHETSGSITLPASFGGGITFGGVATVTSCRAAQRLGRDSGVELIDPDGSGGVAPYQTFCLQDVAGGGWALALEIDGDNEAFTPESPLWENDLLLGADDLHPATPGNAKYGAFVHQPFAAVMLMTEGVPVVLDVRGASLLDVFASEATVPSKTAYQSWRNWLPSSTSLQVGCNRQGLNLVGLAGAEFYRVRIGIFGNGDAIDADCAEPNSFIGVGANVRCGDGTAVVAGNVAPLNGDAGPRCIAVHASVFVRDDDFTHVGEAASCLLHLANGNDESGVYLIDTPEGAQRRRCDMTTDGGGFTNVLDFEASRDCGPPFESIVRDGITLCVLRDDALRAQDSMLVEVDDVLPDGYSQVLARASVYQIASTDAFGSVVENPTIDVYVDGISITTEPPRVHVATFASGISEVGDGCCTCPCAFGVPPPAFVGTAYRCEAGASGDSYTFDDPLFDGIEIAAACAGTAEASDAPIMTDLGAPTTAALEVRLMRDEPALNGENVGLVRLELWAR